MVDGSDIINRGFEYSILVGFLTTVCVILIIAVIALYKDRNKIIVLNTDMTRDSIKALTIVTENQNEISGMSKESMAEIRRLREAIIKNSCKYEKPV